MPSLLRKVAVYAAVIIGTITFGAVPASGGTAQVEYLCTYRGSAPTSTMIEITVAVPARIPIGDYIWYEISLVHGTTSRWLPTASRFADFELLVEGGGGPDRELHNLHNPNTPPGPVTYETTAYHDSMTPHVVSFRPGNIWFSEWPVSRGVEECVPRFPDSVPVLATIEFYDPRSAALG